MRSPLSTGAQSNFCFDCKPVTSSANGSCLVGMAFLDALDRLPARPEAVGGLTHGADPIVSAMVVPSDVRKRPIQGFYVRRTLKRHGTKRRGGASASGSDHSGGSRAGGSRGHERQRALPP